MGPLVPLAPLVPRPRRGAVARWTAVVVLLLVLGGLPALARARPAPADSTVSAAQLIASIRGSSAVAFSGYAESHGTLAIPDISQLGSLPSLLGDTTKIRTWWQTPTQWRVDVVDTLGETDTYDFPSGSWVWDSQRRRATIIDGTPPVRVPRAADLLPSTLGRRLAGSPDVRATRIPPHRVAGRSALGLRLTPTGPSTVAYADVWADRDSGLPLQVQVVPTANGRPALSTAFLTVSLHAPGATVTSFTPPPDAAVTEVSATDLQGLLGHLRPLSAPSSLAGLPAAQPVPGLGGVATYGGGLSTVAVVSLADGDSDHLADTLRGRATTLRLPGARAQQIVTPLVTALLVRTRYRDLLIAGTVPVALLQQAAASLLPGWRSA